MHTYKIYLSYHSGIHYAEVTAKNPEEAKRLFWEAVEQEEGKHFAQDAKTFGDFKIRKLIVLRRA